MPKKESDADRHNRLAREYITTVIRETVRNGGDFSDIFILLESIIVGTMLAGTKYFNMTDAAAIESARLSADEAIRRFTRVRSQT